MYVFKNQIQRIVLIIMFWLIVMNMGVRVEIEAACENLGWDCGYYKNSIVINTIRLPDLYVGIVKSSVSDWNNRSTGYTLSTTSAPVSAYGTGEGKNYVAAYSLNSNTVTGRTSVLTKKDGSRRKCTSFVIIFNTQCYDYYNISDNDKKKFCRSVMGHELGHVLSLDDMDTNNQNKYGKTSIMSYSRDRYTLVSPTEKDAQWARYFK